MGSTASHPSYRADIDGLRAIAVGLVLVFHFRLAPGVGDAGFLGVDLFFVISGYLITRIVVRDLADGSFRFADFYGRRVRRLAPALQVMLLALLVVGWQRLLPLEFDELLRQVVATQFYVANVYFWKNVSYFGLAADQTVLLHTWSLAVEEQFYLLYPLALWAAHRSARLRGRLPWLVAAAAVLSFALNLWLSAAKPSAAFYLLPGRAWQLLAGAWLALRPAGAGSARRADLLALAGLGLLALAVVGHHPGLAIPGGWALLPVAGAALLIRAGEGGHGRLSRWLGAAPLAFIGRLSYPAYLLHWPLHVLAGSEVGSAYDEHAGWRWAMLALTLLLASLVHLGVERPLQRRSRQVPARMWQAAYGACAAVSLGLLAASLYSGGLPGRFSPEVTRLAAAVQDRPPPMTECEWTAGQVPCVIGAAGRPPTWLVYGDSHAWAATPALEPWLQRRGEAAVFSFRHACPPLQGVHLRHDHGVCAAFNEAMLAQLAAPGAPRRVLLISTWRQAPEGALLPAPDARGSTAESLQLFRTQFAVTLRAIAAQGAEIWVWAPVPGARRNPPEVLARAALRGQVPPLLAWSEVQHRARSAFFFEAAAELGPQIAGLIDPATVLCWGGACPVLADGRPLYVDASHVSRAAAPLLLRALEATP